MKFESFQPKAEQPEQPAVESPETLARKAWQETGEEAEGKKVESANEVAINKISRWENLKNMGRSAAEIAGGVGASAWAGSVLGNGAWGMMSGSPEWGLTAGALAATAAVGFSARRWLKKNEQIRSIKDKALEKLGK